MALDRACKAEYDAWKVLGDPDDGMGPGFNSTVSAGVEGAATKHSVTE